MNFSKILPFGKTRFGFALMLLFGLFLSFSAFKQDDAATQNKIAGSNFSGEQLAQGIFFADGPVSDLIPEVAMFRPAGYTSKSEYLQPFRNYQNQVFAEVLRSHPNFFNDLKTAVYSDNPVAVRNAIQDGKNVLGEAMERLHPAASYEALNDPTVREMQAQVESRLSESDILEDDLAVVQDYLNTYGGSASAMVSGLWIAEAVALVAVRVAVAFWVEYHYWTPDSAVTGTGNGLLQDRLVSSVVTRL